LELIYARWLDWSVRIALALLVACFAAYASGLVAPLVPHAELARLWTLPVDRFVAAAGAPTGWGWLGLVGRGDYLNFLGIALLGLITVVCYARILPVLFRSGQRLYAWLAVAQIVVLLIAASGLGAH